MRSLTRSVLRQWRGSVGSRAWLVPSRLILQGNIYVLASALSQAVMLAAWVFLPWRLSVNELGQFGLISFGTDLLMRVILLGMDNAIVRFYVDTERRDEVLRTAYVWLVIGFAIAASTLWLTRESVPTLIRGLSSVYASVMWLMLVSATASAAATTVFSHYMASGQARWYGSLTVMRSLLLGMGYVIAAQLGFGVAGLLTAQIGASVAIATLFYVRTEAGHVKGVVRAPMVREMAGYGLPMLVYAAFALFSDYTGRLMLDRQVSLEELGIFQFFFQIATQVNGLWASLNRAWTPYLFRVLNRDRPQAAREVIRTAGAATSLYALGLVACLLIGKTGLWRLALSPALDGRVDLLYLLLLGPLYCCMYTAMMPLFYFARNTVRVSMVQIALSAATMLLSIYLSAALQANGAAIAWVAGNLLAPILYLACFPSWRRTLRPVLAIIAIWAIGGALVGLCLIEFRAEGLAAVVLCAGAAATVATLIGWQPRTEIAPPEAALIG